MMPRTNWRYATSWEGIKKAMNKCQRMARRLIIEEGGVVIGHPRIQANEEYLQADGVHLTDVGNEQLRVDFEEGIASLVMQ